jgi:hypothetical protein
MYEIEYDEIMRIDDRYEIIKKIIFEQRYRLNEDRDYKKIYIDEILNDKYEALIYFTHDTENMYDGLPYILGCCFFKINNSNSTLFINLCLGITKIKKQLISEILKLKGALTDINKIYVWSFNEEMVSFYDELNFDIIDEVYDSENIKSTLMTYSKY